jgi:uncharacterized membrane protein YbhN (UPF0104 family)
MTTEAAVAAPEPAKSRLLRIVGLVISLLAVAFFVWTARGHLADLSRLELGPGAVLGIGGALVAHILLIVVDGAGWTLLLRGVGQPARVTEALGIFAVSQFAKYVPGNVAQHIGRVLLARQRGFDATPVAMTLVLEAAWAVGTGAVIAMFTLVVVGGNQLAPGHFVPWWQVALVALIAFAGPPTGLHVLARFAPAALSRRMGGRDMVLPNFWAFAWYCGVATSSYAFLGLGVDLLARGLYGAESHFLMLTGIMSVAWLIGFLLPGAPAGLGVRELVLLGLLGRIYDPSTSAQLALLLRLVSTGADAVGLGLGLAILRRTSVRTPAVP